MLPLLQWRHPRDLFLDGLFLTASPFLCLSHFAPGVTVCAAQVLAVKNIFSTEEDGTGMLSVAVN